MIHRKELFRLVMNAVQTPGRQQKIADQIRAHIDPEIPLFLEVFDKLWSATVHHDPGKLFDLYPVFCVLTCDDSSVIGKVDWRQVKPLDDLPEFGKQVVVGEPKEFSLPLDQTTVRQLLYQYIALGSPFISKSLGNAFKREYPTDIGLGYQILFDRAAQDTWSDLKDPDNVKLLVGSVFTSPQGVWEPNLLQLFPFFALMCVPLAEGDDAHLTHIDWTLAV